MEGARRVDSAAARKMQSAGMAGRDNATDRLGVHGRWRSCLLPAACCLRASVGRDGDDDGRERPDAQHRNGCEV